MSLATAIPGLDLARIYSILPPLESGGSTPPVTGGAYDIVTQMRATPGSPALQPVYGCSAAASNTVYGSALGAAAQVAVVPTDATVGIAIDITAILEGYTIVGVPTITATIIAPIGMIGAAPSSFVAAGPTLVTTPAMGATPATTTIEVALLDGTQLAGTTYDVHVLVALSDAPATTHTLVFSVYVQAD